LLDPEGSLREGARSGPEHPAGQLRGVSHTGPFGRTPERGQCSVVNALLRTLYRLRCHNRRRRKRLVLTLLDLDALITDFQTPSMAIHPEFRCCQADEDHPARSLKIGTVVTRTQRGKHLRF
jgi:hypothetical protein